MLRLDQLLAAAANHKTELVFVMKSAKGYRSWGSTWTENPRLGKMVQQLSVRYTCIVCIGNVERLYIAS